MTCCRSIISSLARTAGSAQINATFWEERLTKSRIDGCWFGCTLGCAHAVDGYRVKTGPYQGECVIVDGPEYETIAGVGSNCGIFDPEAIIEMNFYCDTYGIDTISFGTAMAFVMECFEAGVLDLDKTGGSGPAFWECGRGAHTLAPDGCGRGLWQDIRSGYPQNEAVFHRALWCGCRFLSRTSVWKPKVWSIRYISRKNR